MFQPGMKKTGGRQKGTFNKRTKEFSAVLEAHNFNTAEALLWTFLEAKDQYLTHKGIDEDKACKYLNTASGNIKEIANYVYPKLRSVDQIKINPRDLTADEVATQLETAAVKIRKPGGRN